MPINIAGTLENVQLSLDVYLSNVGYMIHQHGVRRFVPPDTDPWIRARYDLLPMTRQFYRQVSDAEVGDEIRGTVELTLCQHARQFSQRYTLASARDAVLSTFSPSREIPIYNFQADDRPQVGALLIFNVTERTLDLGEESGMVQHSISVETCYIEAYTAPF